ncbi:MAG: hypothetical protein HYU99_10315 [Deltaproteobacteria bacterium]|nr:hypothetical protein [Deltaproteobacteria bacterium]
MDTALAKRYLRICNVQTAVTRLEVRRIERDIKKMDVVLQKNLADEERIASGLGEVRRKHKSLDRRLEEAGENLSRCKSYLASFQS